MQTQIASSLYNNSSRDTRACRLEFRRTTQTNLNVMADKKKRLVFSIIEFLKEEAKSGSVQDTESLEVAIQCLGSSYNIDAV